MRSDREPTASGDVGEPVLPRTGEMAERIRNYPWDRAALGAPDLWPQPLKTLASLMLAARQPMFLIWGPEKVWLYNDAFTPILGRKHPEALGRHALDEVWAEARETLAPLFDEVFAGAAVQMDDLALELDRNGTPELAHFTFSYTPVRDETGAVAGLFGVCTETTELVFRRTLHLVETEDRRQTEDALLKSDALLRTFMEAVPGVIYAKDLEGRILVGNEGTARLLGRAYDDFIGRTDLELLDDKAEAAAVMANDRRIMTTGLAEQVEEQVTFPNGATAWWLSTKAPLRGPDGQVIGLVGSSVDITERRRLEEHRQLLVNELNHRVKNTLAVVQGLARQTFRRPDNMRGALDSFEERLSALSRAHNLLTDENWASASLRDVVRDQLADRLTDRIALDGPDVLLSPQVAVSLALVLHELGTNATKYGALSNDSGQVAVSWTVDGDRSAVRLRWVETGGPPVVAPDKRGFGSRMIERALAAEGGGRVTLQFPESGVICDVEAPVAG